MSKLASQHHIDSQLPPSHFHLSARQGINTSLIVLVQLPALFIVAVLAITHIAHARADCLPATANSLSTSSHHLYVFGRQPLIRPAPIRSAVVFLAGFARTNSLQTGSPAKESVQQEPGPIGPGLPIDRELKGGETHSFRIHLVSGQFLYLIVNQKGLDVAVALVGPGGQPLLKVDSPNSNHGLEPLVMIAEATGEYLIKVSAPNKSASAGRYEIKVVATREATATDRDHVAADRAFWEGYKLRLQRTATSSREAIEKYKQALPFFESSKDHYRQALTLMEIGSIHAGLGEFQRALECNEQALPLFRIVGKRISESNILNSIGGVHHVLGNLPKAREYYRQALSVLPKGSEPNTQAAILSNIGQTYNDVSDWQQAFEYYHQALSIFRTSGEKRREAITLNNIGVAYASLGEREKSLDYYQQALTLRRAIGDKPGEASTLTSIGQAYTLSGEALRALEFYRQALPLRRAAGDRLGEATTLDYMGMAYSSLREQEKALDFHQQALELRKAVGDVRGEARTLSNLGYLYTLSGQSEKAMEYYNQALAILRRIGDRQNEAKALYGLARTERNRGSRAEARQHIEAALSLFENVRANAGAEQLRASYLASKQDAYQFCIGLLMEMHRLEPTKGHDAVALQTSERARARSLLEMLAEAHADIRQGVDAALLERESNLKQQLNVTAQRQIRLLGQKSSQEQLAQLNKELSALEDEYQQVQAELRKRSPAYAALTQPQPLRLKEIQRQLDPNTVLLEYSLGEERSYVWAVTQSALKSYELPKGEQIEAAARQFYELLTVRSLFTAGESAAVRRQRIAQADSRLLESSRELSRMVLGPVASELGSKRLVIVADGALQYVPFAALQKPSVASGQLSAAKNTRTIKGQLTVPTYQPLVVDHEIISLPSASALAVQRMNLANRKPRRNAVAVIGDPVFSIADERLKANVRTVEPSETPTGGARTRIIEHLADDSGKLVIRRLPFTRQEAEQILAVAPRAANMKALDFKANRATATSSDLGNYRYVHFATHGYLDSERPDLSAIVLSLVDEQGKAQDGFLRAHEIYNLNLPAELVVLSACQTGLGKEIKGEGLVGLTRGFMYAGARRVVVSLWNVNDKATAEMMQHFYRRILRARQTPAASLRAAQIEMWRQKQWQSPYYWAAFVLQGEWK
jgi:CHAT domain-containing protein/Tfp pilus assembly protein PilF